MTGPQKGWLYGGFGVAAVSGLSFAAMKYLLDGADPFSAYNHPLQPHALAVHVLAGPVAVFVLGWVFAAHVTRHLKSAVSGRRTGWGMLGAALPMVGSGYLMQVSAAEGWRGGLAWVHGISGTAFLLALVVHAVTAARRGRTGMDVSRTGGFRTGGGRVPDRGAGRGRSQAGPDVGTEAVSARRGRSGRPESSSAGS